MALKEYFFILSLLTPDELREFMKELGIQKHAWGSMGFISSYDEKDARKLINYLKKNNRFNKILIKGLVAKLNTK